MATITGTLVKATEFAGNYKILSITATLAAASDAITLTLATHGISEITGVIGCISSGMTTTFTNIHISYSGLVITVKSINEGGTDATTFGNIALFVIGK